MLTLTAEETAAVADGLDPKEIRPRRIPCSFCGSPEGRACVAPTGTPGPAHPARIRAAYATKLLRVKAPPGAKYYRWDVVDGIGGTIGKVTGEPEGPFKAVFFDRRDGKRHDREVARTSTTREARAKISSHSRLIEELRLGIAEIQILDLSNIDGATR